MFSLLRVSPASQFVCTFKEITIHRSLFKILEPPELSVDYTLLLVPREFFAVIELLLLRIDRIHHTKCLINVYDLALLWYPPMPALMPFLLFKAR